MRRPTTTAHHTEQENAISTSRPSSGRDPRGGLTLGVTAYVLWGGFPLYFPLLQPADAFEILAHRIVWSALTMGLLVVLLRRTSQFRALVRNRRTLALLGVAGFIISINWATYIWAVNDGRVVEASLGYFITPLLSVLMGVALLGERLRRWQVVAVGVAVSAVVVLTIDYGRPPWIALVLAFSFGCYSLAKKTADAGAVESLALETAIVGPFAAAYIAWLVSSGESGFGAHGVGHALLLASAGIVTAVPLICFGAAATRIPMVTMGLLQYLAPVLQFALGVLWFKEDMPVGRWIGFFLVWVALMLFTWEALRHRRREIRRAAEAFARS